MACLLQFESEILASRTALLEKVRDIREAQQAAEEFEAGQGGAPQGAELESQLAQLSEEAVPAAAAQASAPSPSPVRRNRSLGAVPGGNSMPVLLIGYPINLADYLTGCPITCHYTGSGQGAPLGNFQRHSGHRCHWKGLQGGGGGSPLPVANFRCSSQCRVRWSYTSLGLQRVFEPKPWRSVRLLGDAAQGAMAGANGGVPPPDKTMLKLTVREGFTLCLTSDMMKKMTWHQLIKIWKVRRAVLAQSSS